MSTVGQVIDRVIRDFLASPEDQPTRFTLSALLSDSATSLTYSSALLAAEEEDLLGPGTLIEIDSEQMLVGAVDETTNTLSGLIRAVNGTTAAQHASGAMALIAPTWSRKTVFDAVADAIVELWPDLYWVTSTASLSFSTTPTEVAATVAQPMYVWGRPTGQTTYDQLPVVFFDNYPPSSTGKAILAPEISGGGNGYMTYQSKFARPTSEATDLSTVGVNAEWERLVIISAVAYLITGKDIDAATSEMLTQQLSEQGFPVASGARLRDALLRYQEFLLRKAKRSMRTLHQTPVVTTEAAL